MCHAHENYKTVRFQCLNINFSWNKALLIHLRIVFGCFCAITAELSNVTENI